MLERLTTDMGCLGALLRGLDGTAEACRATVTAMAEADPFEPLIRWLTQPFQVENWMVCLLVLLLLGLIGRTR